MKKLTKRFIAGATCPKCGQLDSIFMAVDAEPPYAQCLDCEFRFTEKDKVEPHDSQAKAVKWFPAKTTSPRRKPGSSPNKRPSKAGTT